MMAHGDGNRVEAKWRFPRQQLSLSVPLRSAEPTCTTSIFPQSEPKVGLTSHNFLQKVARALFLDRFRQLLCEKPSQLSSCVWKIADPKLDKCGGSKVALVFVCSTLPNAVLLCHKLDKRARLVTPFLASSLSPETEACVVTYSRCPDCLSMKTFGDRSIDVKCACNVCLDGEARRCSRARVAARRDRMQIG